jgi:dolichol-phosphate mannosyltransferase
MIYVLLPVYNEEKNIDILIDKIRNGLTWSKQDYMIVAYDDGSCDGSRARLEAKAASGAPLAILGEKDNRGLGYGLQVLLRYAVNHSRNLEEDIAVILDADNSHNPEHISSHMVDKIRDGFDLVIASRYLKDSRVVGVSTFRVMLSYGASILMQMLFPIKGVKDYTCGYRAYRVEMLKKAFSVFGSELVTERSFACMAELLIKLGKMGVLAVEIPLILRYDQKAGASKMDVLKTVRRTLRMILQLKMTHVGKQ